VIKEAIATIVSGQSLSRDEAAQVMEEIMEGQATPAQIAGFITALRIKGETVEEMAGLATVMRAKAMSVPYGGPVIDTCGTGGDAQGTFNVSTATAFVVAAAGLRVAKHGNRAMSSQCGSADVLEALGVRIDLGPAQVAACLQDVGVGFMFAPSFHPAMKYAAGPRREIGIRTVFNVLGPLTNPAGAQSQLLGVAEADLAPKMAEVLRLLGSGHALVVHGQDGVDEVSIAGPTLVCEVRDGRTLTYTVAPEDLGVRRASLASIKGGSATENARAIREVLTGVPGPRRDIVVLNAAAALFAGDRATSLSSGVEMACRAIDSGMALRVLDTLISYTQAMN